MQAFVPGIYPRSEALVQATRDLDRGRTTQEAVDEQLERDLRELVRLQQEAGLDPLADGMLRWQDLWRPLAEAADGLEARPLVRFLDTNTFYRAILVHAEPQLREPLPPPSLPDARWLGTLPSPLSFSRATAGAVPPAVLARSVLAPQLEAWAAGGCALVVLDEPFLALDPRGIDELADALEALPRPVSLYLRLPFADAGPLLPRLSELAVDGLGIDFYATSLGAVPADFGKTIVAGVVDVRSSRPEDPDDVARFVDALMERRPAGIALAPNGDLQFVAEPIAREKLTTLGRAAAALAAGAPA